MTSPLAGLLSDLDKKVQRDYEDSHAVAKTDPQQGGHIAEATWVSVLSTWLPPGYSAGTRRYIVPELNDDSFEMDLVIFRPSVPTVIREQTRVPHGAVAAAFSVRLTADRAGLKDAVLRAVRLRRSMDRSIISDQPDRQMLPAYPVGFLSLSHDWASSPMDMVHAVTSILLDLDRAEAEHPSESLDICCIGDLGTWTRKRVPYIPPVSVALYTGEPDVSEGCPMTLLIDPVASQPGVAPPPNPVGIFVRELYSALETNDPQLQELSYSLRKGVPIPSGTAAMRLFRDLTQ